MSTIISIFILAMQCDPTCSNYSPCVTSCPPDTCDNFMNPLKTQRLCNLETCVEGCKLKGCPEGSVYVNSSYSECVPITACNPVCLIENGVTYYEGDLMASDTCHTCKCSRGKKICTGVPCSIDVPDVSGKHSYFKMLFYFNFHSHVMTI